MKTVTVVIHRKNVKNEGYNSEFAKANIPLFKGYYAVTTRFLSE